MEPNNLGVVCELCGSKVDATTVADHFADQHLTIDWSFETWPDGTPVLIDETLTPGDFDGT